MSGRALVTGAQGFVGRVLSAYLAEQGWDVVRTDCAGGEGVIPCDVADRGRIDALLEQAGELSHVFHLAAMTFVPAATRDPIAAMDVNFLGSIRLTTALLERNPKVRFLYVGSAEAYGPPLSLPITEDHPLNPANPYALSKAAADHYFAYLARTSALDVVRMRPFNHSGTGQSEQFVLSNFARQIARIEAGRAEPVIRVGDLSTARDFLHVDDVVRAYELAALHGRAGEAYNVCSGTARPIQDALDALLGMSGAAIEIAVDPARMRPADVPEVYGSHAKLTADTGWEPTTPFETIVRDLLEAWRMN